MPVGKRQRKAWDVASDVREHLDTIEPGHLSRYVNRALRHYTAPPARWKIPSTPAEGSPHQLIEEANSEIIATGVSLFRILESHTGLLEEKIKDHVSMTFGIIDQEFFAAPEVHPFLLRLFREESIIEGTLEQIKSSLRVLRDLHKIAVEHRTSMNIIRFPELPPYGLLIRDHGRAKAKMRVNFYTIPSYSRSHPYVDINPSTKEGEITYNIFYEYYVQLLSRGGVEGFS